MKRECDFVSIISHVRLAVYCLFTDFMWMLFLYSDARVTCTLWEDYAKHVFEYAKLNSTSVVVCVIKFACVGEYNGEFMSVFKCLRCCCNVSELLYNSDVYLLPLSKLGVLTISNSYNTSRVMLDPKDVMVERFRSKYVFVLIFNISSFVIFYLYCCAYLLCRLHYALGYRLRSMISTPLMTTRQKILMMLYTRCFLGYSIHERHLIGLRMLAR